jgi:hypothetical protein
MLKSPHCWGPQSATGEVPLLDLKFLTIGKLSVSGIFWFMHYRQVKYLI